MLRYLAVLVTVLAVISWGTVAIPPYPPPDIEAKVTYVVDGDTIEVLIKSLPSPAPQGLRVGRTVRIRYIGVDAPEVTDPNGSAATDLNAALVQNKTVYLELDETLYDPHNRLLAYVYLDPQGYLMVNLMLVATEIIGARFDSDAPRYESLFRYFDATPAPIMPSQEECLPWREAKEHVGEIACVEGVVASVGTSRGGDLFLNLGNAYPSKNRFTIFIPARCAGLFETQFGSRFWRQLKGKTVSAYGEIRLYKGVPEIELCDPSRLSIK